MLNLWLQSDFRQAFESNIEQLNPIFDEIIAMQDFDLANQELKLRRALFILRGLFAGAQLHKNFVLLFDWFYPQYFAVVTKCLSMQNNEEVLILALKFLHELANNSSSRLKFDTWSTNSLIIYKETSNCLISFMSEFFTPSRPIQDFYKSNLRF